MGRDLMFDHFQKYLRFVVFLLMHYLHLTVCLGPYSYHVCGGF